MSRKEPETSKQLPPPWDRIFSLSSRVFVWGLLFAIIYILRPFSLLLFLTFVFAYILEHGVQGLKHRVPSRTARVLLVTVVFLGTLTTAGIFLATPLQQQASKLAQNYPTYINAIDREIADARESSETVQAMIPEGVSADELVNNLLGLVEDDGEAYGVSEPRNDQDQSSLPDSSGDGPAPPEPDPQRIQQALERLKNIATPILGIGSAFLLSLLFSFLIVLDLPKLSRGVSGLAKTKLGFIYDEAAENIHDFGVMVGRALEAQLLIAICNMALTAIGLYFLGLTTNIVFLSTIVFFCSFIPVAGVFISSLPICIEALSNGGVQLTLIAIGIILAIHTIETYVLNPRIFGHHLRMNAVLVLIVLTIAGKLFGIWGLVLGLPMVNYFFGHAIRYRKLGEKRTSPATPGTE
jgi:predicted PurR-regulated permease PerM